MWEAINGFPIKIGKLTPVERRKRGEQSMNRIRFEINFSQSTINEAFPPSE